MTTKDILITPILIFVIFLVSLFLFRQITDKHTRRYFYPALLVRIFGALALGLIYQFYYKGGDTFTYFSQGSYYIWKAFLDSPVKGLTLIFGKAGAYTISTYDYASRITFFTDPSSYFVIRIGGIFDLITFHTYSATAVLFALFSFTGSWAMFRGFYKMFPRLHLPFALAIFFIPSVFFWGSGLMKDSITLGAMGWATYAFINIFIKRENVTSGLFILLISFYILYVVKIYILLCFIPSLLIWLYFQYITSIRNLVVRAMFLPFFLAVIVAAGYYSIISIGAENTKYNLTSIAETAKATAKWISYVSETEGGSTYNLGDFDFSPAGMLAKSYKAVWVTLFRPYIWESRNPVMLFSALESLFFLLITLYVLFICGFQNVFRVIFTRPVVIFCFVFAITFSFAVGISTYNFGSLVRYKIPMMPFYIIGLVLIYYHVRRPRKLLRFDSVEN